jgi:hypothetical protein
MIICSCNVISGRDVREAAVSLLDCTGLQLSRPPVPLRALLPLGQKNSARAARRFRGIEDILITGPRPVGATPTRGHKAQRNARTNLWDRWVTPGPRS